MKRRLTEQDCKEKFQPMRGLYFSFQPSSLNFFFTLTISPPRVPESNPSLHVILKVFLPSIILSEYFLYAQWKIASIRTQ